MKIAVNTRFLIPGKMTGLGHYTYELLKKLVPAHPEVEFLFFFDRQFDPAFIFAPNITPVIIFPPARAPLLFYVWFEWAVPAAVKRYKPDLFLSPDNFMSLSLNIPTVLIIHDLAFEHYPDDLSFGQRIYYRHYMSLFAAKADRIVAVSDFTKKDIIQRYEIEEKKVSVAHPGLNEGFTHARNNNSMHDYFIHLGTIQPRKNIVRLLKAFDNYKKMSGDSAQLIFIGTKGWKDQGIYAFYDKMKYKQDIIFKGYLTNEEIAEYLQNAIALLCVSYFEGFGMPIIEAQQMGCPVICSNVSSLPEAAGDGALFIDPFDEQSISEAMVKIKNDQKFRNDLIERGFFNSSKYSWSSAAVKVWESILAVRK